MPHSEPMNHVQLEDGSSWRRVNLPRSLPILAMQVLPLTVFLTGWSWFAVGVAAALYAVRMFAITGFYHRYFSHRSFQAGRLAQLVFAFLGNSAVQRGPLWWASHHRFHHRHADREPDMHSPTQHGLFWSHMGWLLCDLSRPTRTSLVPDLARFPELRFLDRYYWLSPLLLAVGLYFMGESLATHAPSLGTSGWQLVAWGFFLSTFVLYHATYSVNSIAHRFGTRRYETRDDSRNVWWLALLTLGEGWHNNHHRWPSSVRQGLRWWELDITWYGLWLLSKLGVVRDLQTPPVEAVSGKTP